MKPSKKKKLRLHKKIVIALIIVSIALLFLGPFEEVKTGLQDNAPTLITGLIISESLFLIGLLTMAIVAGYDLGKNPLLWRSQFHKLPHILVEQKLFWFGFWINATGALLSGVIITWGVIHILPARSWALAYLGFLDIGLTIFVRAEILKLKTLTEQSQ